MAGDNTQFLVDMAAKLTGGDASVATLAELGDRMLKAGATSKELEDVVKRTSAALEDSGAAMKVASDAVAAGELKYRELEGSAAKASKAVEQIGNLAEAQRGKLQAAMDAGDGRGAERAAEKLRGLIARQSEAVAKSGATKTALEEEAAALDAVKASAAAATAQHDSLTKGLANVESAAEEAAKAEKAASGTRNVNEIAEAMGKLGGPAGVAGQKLFGLATGFKKLGASLGSAGPYIAVAVAIVAVASAALLATVAIGKWSVSLADANRTQTLLAAGVARSVEGGRELEASIAKLGNEVPQTREELLSMAGDLAKTGLRGKELTGALEEAAVKAAELKWGPEFSKQLLSLDSQSRRLGTNLAGTFGGLKIEKLLGGVSTLVALFDSTTESGQTLKFLFEALFQPIVDGVADVMPKVERFFLHAEILALKAYIALKPYSGIIKAIGEGFLIAAGIVVGVLGVAVLAVFASIATAIAGPVLLMGLFVAGLRELWSAVVEGGPKAIAFMGDLGASMVDGLVNGITGGAAAVVDAMSNVVGGAIDSAKNLLGIASPSKVFASIGENTSAGFAEGVDGGADDAQGALQALVAPPREGAGAGGAGGGVSVVVQTLIVQGENAKAMAADFIEQLTSLLEGDALTVGGGEAPANA